VVACSRFHEFRRSLITILNGLSHTKILQLTREAACVSQKGRMREPSFALLTSTEILAL
jgi:hypothetical protein